MGGGPTLWTPRIYEGGTQKEKGESPTWRGNHSNKLVVAAELDSVELRCRRKWRTPTER